MNKNIILVNGTSSTGKTNICKFFETKMYKCLEVDAFLDEMYDEASKIEGFDMLPVNEQNEILTKILTNILFNNFSRGEKVLIDTVNQEDILDELKKRNMLKDTFVIVNYASLRDMARNLKSRYEESDPRGFYAFEQYPSYYHKSKSKGIDIVNRKDFKNILGDFVNNFKNKDSFHSFKNKKELNEFANKIFKQMGINDDKDHFVTLRNDIVADLVFDTTGKTKNEIFDLLSRYFNF